MGRRHVAVSARITGQDLRELTLAAAENLKPEDLAASAYEAMSTLNADEREVVAKVVNWLLQGRAVYDDDAIPPIKTRKAGAA